jgi:hypothetical protein
LRTPTCARFTPNASLSCQRTYSWLAASAVKAGELNDAYLLSLQSC